MPQEDVLVHIGGTPSDVIEGKQSVRNWFRAGSRYIRLIPGDSLQIDDNAHGVVIVIRSPSDVRVKHVAQELRRRLEGAGHRVVTQFPSQDPPVRRGVRTKGLEAKWLVLEVMKDHGNQLLTCQDIKGARSVTVKEIEQGLTELIALGLAVRAGERVGPQGSKNVPLFRITAAGLAHQLTKPLPPRSDAQIRLLRHMRSAHGPQTKPDMGKGAGVSDVYAGQLIHQLIARGEARVVDSSTGRKPALFELTEEGRQCELPPE